MISPIEFVDFLASLAPEDETALIVKQKAITKQGSPQYHNDGTPKYTWLPLLPSKYIPEGAMYGNTASFILDRFVDGKLSASSANCEYVLVMVLDDIYTKSKEPLIEPTWKMETSEGNFQWGYVFDCNHAPTKGEFTAAIKAIADAGYTDGGATNAVRNFRLPASINLKQNKNLFASRLTEFHRHREFTLDQICDALDVIPNEADTSSRRTISLIDTGDDDLLQWISDSGMLLETINGSGWAGVTCPNSNAHSDHNPMARYNPLHRSFCCYHESCQHLDSKSYLEWAAENGAPRHEVGIRPELLTEKMANALVKIAPTEKFKDSTILIENLERKELARVAQSDWYARFAYVQSDDSYFDLLARNDISRGTFNALYRHVPCKSNNGGRRIESSVCYDENRLAHNAKALRGLAYASGESALVGREGELYGNRWTDGRPVITSTGGNIDKWLDHCRRLVPVESEIEHIWNVMAFKLQNPKIKINHAVLHVGDEGCGKDLMWRPFIWSVCGAQLKNISIVDGDRMQSQFNDHLEAEIMVLNELKEPDSATRRDLANKLKPVIAAPPDMFSVNPKGKKRYDIANRIFVLAFSNEQIPISLSSQDRRWFCISSDTPPMEKVRAGSGAELVRWYEDGNLEHIAAWLYARDVSAFNPGATPAMTEFKTNLLESGMSSLESIITEMLKMQAGEFARGVISSPLHPICDRIADIIGLARGKVPQSALLHALKEAGWVDCGRLASGDCPNKKRVFASIDAIEKFSKSELRRMVETPPEPKAVVLDMKSKRTA